MVTTKPTPTSAMNPIPEIATGFRVLKRTRRRPESGDVFTFQLNCLPERFYFGRVVATDTHIGNLQDVILIYIYRLFSKDKQHIPRLVSTDLLLPPKGINALPWTKGYFEVIASSNNLREDLLPVHCFRDYLTGGYVDEYGRHLPGPTEPVGFNAMGSYKTLNEDICKALGFQSAN
jgi:hypothetical protein